MTKKKNDADQDAVFEWTKPNSKDFDDFMYNPSISKPRTSLDLLRSSSDQVKFADTNDSTGSLPTSFYESKLSQTPSTTVMKAAVTVTGFAIPSQEKK
jgi:hypothetical protein